MIAMVYVIKKKFRLTCAALFIALKKLSILYIRLSFFCFIDKRSNNTVIHMHWLKIYQISEHIVNTRKKCTINNY